MRVVVGQWVANGTNEPTRFREILRKLVNDYPMLRLITGDAIFAQRPLIKLIRKLDKDYLFQVKGNQGDTLEALEHCFANALSKTPAAQTIDKKGDSGCPSFMGRFRKRGL